LKDRLAGMADVVFLLSELIEEIGPDITERFAYAIVELNKWRSLLLAIKPPYEPIENYLYKLDSESNLFNENITIKTIDTSGEDD